MASNLKKKKTYKGPRKYNIDPSLEKMHLLAVAHLDGL